nr:immunoglobulin heavy chain junction region [Macaca mulatta]MOV53902.1 immunoglobulin heavy chain junction region [Macaca mulatta]MOV54091.1 immunoglobulin heavy chain junction region [Macaca mulatta]MOV54254.1 immunoglobulin heavy chain junction region [Macaca mulatta]MOV54483.1 immunoglobulin heavy chain junction region [Macaca mulatta]
CARVPWEDDTGDYYTEFDYW